MISRILTAITLLACICIPANADLLNDNCMVEVPSRASPEEIIEINPLLAFARGHLAEIDGPALSMDEVIQKTIECKDKKHSHLTKLTPQQQAELDEQFSKIDKELAKNAADDAENRESAREAFVRMTKCRVCTRPPLKFPIPDFGSPEEDVYCEARGDRVEEGLFVVQEASCSDERYLSSFLTAFENQPKSVTDCGQPCQYRRQSNNVIYPHTYKAE